MGFLDGAQRRFNEGQNTRNEQRTVAMANGEDAEGALDDQSWRGELAAAISAYGGNSKLVKNLESTQAAREGVLMLAGATLPAYGVVEQPSLSAAQTQNQPRLLVLTRKRLWEMRTAHRTGFGEIVQEHVALDRVQDEVRTLLQRRPGRLGMKDRFLIFEHHRGGDLETVAYDLKNDQMLQQFAARMNEQLEALREEAAGVGQAQEAQKAEALAQAIAGQQARASVADEIARLHALVEQGALTEEEFADAKGRLLQDM